MIIIKADAQLCEVIGGQMTKIPNLAIKGALNHV